MLLLLAPEAQPVARRPAAALAIDVEPLMGVPSLGPCPARVSLSRELAVVRQHERGDPTRRPRRWSSRSGVAGSTDDPPGMDPTANEVAVDAAARGRREPPRKRWNTMPRCVSTVGRSAGIARERASSSTSTSPTSRSRSSQSTTVPGSARSARAAPRDPRAALVSRHHSPRSRDEVEIPAPHREPAAAARLATVRLRHCEKDAVLRPRPKRPRSSAARSSRGLRLPSRIAVRSSSSVMPRPSSATDNPRVGAPPSASDLDRLAPGGDAVVDEVGDRGGGRIAESAHRLDHRRRVRRHDLVLRLDRAIENQSSAARSPAARAVSPTPSAGQSRHRRESRSCAARCRARAAVRRRSGRRRARRCRARSSARWRPDRSPSSSWSSMIVGRSASR